MRGSLWWWHSEQSYECPRLKGYYIVLGQRRTALSFSEKEHYSVSTNRTKIKLDTNPQAARPRAIVDLIRAGETMRAEVPDDHVPTTPGTCERWLS